MEIGGQLKDQAQEPPATLPDAVIASLALRDLYGVRRLHPDALSVDDTKNIHRVLVERLNAAIGNSRFDALRQNMYCEPRYENLAAEGKLSQIFAALIAQCPDVQIVGIGEKAIAESIDQGVKWCHERCSQNLQDLLLRLFEIKAGDRTVHVSEEGTDGGYCRVITRNGSRAADKAQYEMLINASDEYDMFIDGMTQRASCRDGENKVRTERLTPKELGILSDFIQVGKPMRPYDSKTGNSCASSSSAYRLFEGARRKVDTKLGRYVYRAFRLHKHPRDRKLNAHEFAPPDDLAYCLILPA